MSRDPGVFDHDLDNPYRAPVADVGPQKPVGGRYTGYAGFWIRFVAWFIDWIVVRIFAAMIFVILGGLLLATGTDSEGTLFQVLSWIFGLTIEILYFASMESSSSQATLGKMALGLKVVDVYGRRLTFGRAVGREAGKILSGLILAVGYIMAGFDDRKQALHDKMASTLVMKTR